MSDTIDIPYKEKGRKPRGEDGYTYTSLRLRNETIAQLDELAAKSNRSRNEVITIILESGINKAQVTDK